MHPKERFALLLAYITWLFIGLIAIWGAVEVVALAFPVALGARTFLLNAWCVIMLRAGWSDDELMGRQTQKAPTD